MIPLGLIESLTSMVWTRRFRTPGEMALKLPFSDTANEMLVVGNIVMKTGGNEAMEITYKNLSKDDNNMDTIEVQGKSLMQWFDRRVIVNKIDTANLTTQGVLKKMVSENITAPSDSKRKIACMSLYDRAAYTLDAIDYQSDDYADLLDAVENLLSTSQMGCLITTDAPTNTHLIDFVQPTDKTSSSSYPCVFSVDFGSLGKQSYTHSTEQYKNMAYVKGSDDDVTLIGNDLTGYDRREVYLTVDEDDTAATGTKANKRKQKGNEQLASSYAVEQTFDGEVETSTNSLVYGVDYDLGDRVTCQYNRWGIRVDATISEIEETYENGVQTVNVTFGEGKPVISKAIKALTK